MLANFHMFQYNRPLSCFVLLYVQQDCSLNQLFQKQYKLLMSVYHCQNNALPILLKGRAPNPQNHLSYILYSSLILDKKLDSKYFYFDDELFMWCG